KPVNELDRFAIDFGLCTYCGICVEVCPFDALHWSTFFEYTSYTYEGMVHEQEVLEGWEHHVLPPPHLVADADEKSKELTNVAHDKLPEAIGAVIGEADKKDAYLARQAGQTVAAPVASETPPAAQPPIAAVQAPAAGPEPPRKARAP